MSSVFAPREGAPIRVLQFGQGNFLRAFADDFIDQMNQKGLFCGSVAVVKTTARGDLEAFRRQNNRYTLCVRGVQNGKKTESDRVIGCISKALSCHEDPEGFFALAELGSLRFVISNTTEAGIALSENDSYEGMPESFPAKLTKFLHLRYLHFQGASDKGMILIPTELIEDNGKRLKECILALCERWGLEKGFSAWIREACIFCDTLVDRIVSGYPKNEDFFKALGYEDALADVCEPFASWVIAAPPQVRKEFPLDKAELPVVFCNDVRPYRERKVRILNGAHTSFSPLGVLCAQTTVKNCMDSPLLRRFLEKILEEEIKPFVPLPKEEVDGFTASVLERFENPFLNHALLSICLNSISKFKARLLGSFRDFYESKKTVPPLICFSFAALLLFYSGNFQGESFVGKTPEGKEYQIKDDKENLLKMERMSKLSPEEYVACAAKETSFWGEDLSRYEGFCQRVTKALKALKKDPLCALSEVI